MFRTRIATALATLGLTALTLTALPGTAQASEPDRGAPSPLAAPACDSSYFCFWVNINFGGDRGQVAGNNPTWTRFSEPTCPSGTWNDCASSGFNNGTSGLGVRVYENANYTGRSTCLPKGWYGNFTGKYWDGTTTNINDKISSNRWMAC